jgi:hypothetical protein
MRLPAGTIVYIAGKKYVRNIPDELAPDHLKSGKTDTKELKKISKSDKKDGE